MSPTMLKVHEITNADGTLASVFLTVEEVEGERGALAFLQEGTAMVVLPEGALDAVMNRYAAPLEPSEPLTRVAKLDLSEGCALHHVRHLARYDVIARDYLIYEVPDREPVCALAATVAGALGHLARAGG